MERDRKIVYVMERTMMLNSRHHMLMKPKKTTSEVAEAACYASTKQESHSWTPYCYSA